MEDEKQRRIIAECLNAAAFGRFFPDWEFQTLFGLKRDELAKIAAEWPHVDQTSEMVNLAVNNSINNLLGYPIKHSEELSHYLSISREELHIIFDSWRNEPSIEG